MSVTLTVNANVELAEPVKVMALPETLAATPPAEQRAEARACRSVLAAAKSISGSRHGGGGVVSFKGRVVFTYVARSVYR
jgi:hypothetical protein